MAYNDEREWMYRNGYWEWLGSMEDVPNINNRIVSIPDDVDYVTIKWRGQYVSVSVGAVMTFLKQFETA